MEVPEAAGATVAGPIEAAFASQVRIRGSGVGVVLEVIQVKDDDGVKACGSPDIGIEMFRMPDAKLEPEGRDAEGWVMGSSVPSDISVVGGGVTGACMWDCGNPLKSADWGCTCGLSISGPT